MSCLIFPAAGGNYVYSSSVTINISSQESLVVTFTPPWHAEEGSYNVQVTTRLFGDENPDNNRMIVPVTVLPAIPGDVDVDRDVDIFDIVLIQSCIGKEKGDPGYNPNCDINNDDEVDIFDMVIAASNYGKSW